MDINSLTIGQVRELQSLLGSSATSGPDPIYADKIGKPVIIRTVTLYHTGILAQVGPTELVLTECAWIPDTGRWADALRSARTNECEPFPAADRVVIGRGAIIDCAPWHGDLPAVQR